MLKDVPGWFESEDTEPLTLSLADEDWLLEITPDGRLICVAGYDLDDMKSLLSDGTAEDLGSDELAKQVKFFFNKPRQNIVGDLLPKDFLNALR